MATKYTTHLQLPKHDPTDPFDITLINEMADKTEAGILTAYKGRAAYNLLDNSDFARPINQRGNTTYSGSGYTIDRWKSTNGRLTTTVNDGYITLTASSAGSGYLRQIFAKPITSGVYTLAICAKASASGSSLYFTTDGSSSGAGTLNIGTGNDFAVYCKAVDLSSASSSPNQCSINCNAGNTVDVKWVAVYEGNYTAETLPLYIPKGYAAELMECQRYYFRTIGQGYGYCTNASAARLNIPIPVMMRAVPSVDNDSITFTCHNNGNNITATSFSVAEMHGASIRLNLTSDAAFTRYTPLAGYASAEFGFSAEL